MNKNIVHTLANARKRIEPSHKMTSTRDNNSNVQLNDESHMIDILPKRDVLSRCLLR
jgi:hypothetical protein